MSLTQSRLKPNDGGENVCLTFFHDQGVKMPPSSIDR